LKIGLNTKNATLFKRPLLRKSQKYLISVSSFLNVSLVLLI